MNMNQKCTLAVTNRILGCIRKSVASRLRKMTVPLCGALLRLHLEYRVQFWIPWYKRCIGKLGQAQQRTTKLAGAGAHDVQRETGKAGSVQPGRQGGSLVLSAAT